MMRSLVSGYLSRIPGIASMRYVTHFFSASLPTKRRSFQWILYFSFIDASYLSGWKSSVSTHIGITDILSSFTQSFRHSDLIA